MTVEKISIKPDYRKDNGLWVLNTLTVPLSDKFQVVEQSIVFIPPLQIGGNHKHPRLEAFIGFGEELYLYWQDMDGTIHEEAMNTNSELNLFMIPSHIPHAVKNKSHDKNAILYEYANDKQHDVEVVKLTE